jgi:hypothetical protein
MEARLQMAENAKRSNVVGFADVVFRMIKQVTPHLV